MQSEDSSDVLAFVVEILDDCFQHPQYHALSAHMLIGLLIGLDTVRRYCEGANFTDSLHGFRHDWERKFQPNFELLDLVDIRLREQGKTTPTEKDRMNVVVEVWREITGV